MTAEIETLIKDLVKEIHAEIKNTGPKISLGQTYESFSRAIGYRTYASVLAALKDTEKTNRLIHNLAGLNKNDLIEKVKLVGENLQAKKIEKADSRPQTPKQKEIVAEIQKLQKEIKEHQKSLQNLHNSRVRFRGKMNRFEEDRSMKLGQKIQDAEKQIKELWNQWHKEKRNG